MLRYLKHLMLSAGITAAGIFAILALMLAVDPPSRVAAQSNFVSARLYCYVVGPPANWLPCDATNPLPVDATVSANVTGFAPAVTGTPITAATVAATGTLPAGTVVVAFNTSTSIPAYCKLGATATVADILIAPSSWFAYTVGAATQLTCITASSTAVINTIGGSGLATGAGGGGGSGGGGSSSTFGAAFPATGTAIGFTDGTNMAAGRVGAVANVAAATNFVDSLGVCQYLASAPTITNTRFNQIQCDVNGYLRVSVQNTNANGQATMANSSPVVIASNQSAIPVSGAGTSSTFGAAFPATGTAIGFTDGTNMVAGRVGAAANLAAATSMPNALGICQYLAAAPTLTDTRFNQVQCDVNGYLRVNVMSAIGLAQGSTTSGQTGSLVMGAVTTSAPSYTTAQTSPLSLTTTGDLRVSVTDQQVADPCSFRQKTSAAFSQTAGAVLIGASGSNKAYICSITLIAAAAEIIAITDGTGTVCASGTPVALIGSTTVANGLSFAANGGITFGNGGATLVKSSATNRDVCLLQSGSNRVAGSVSYVLAP